MRANLAIEKLVYGGTGLARHGDTTVLVPHVLPGERVDVDFQPRRGVAHGIPVAWSKSSSERCDAPCPVYGSCGGCHYQHMHYEAQTARKREILVETLRRIGGIRWDRETPVVQAEPWGYRNRLQIRLDWQHGRPVAGFFAARSHRLVATQACALASPALAKALTTLTGLLRRPRFPRGLRTVELFANEHDLQVNLPRNTASLPKRFWKVWGERLGVAGPGSPLVVGCGPDALRVSGRSFFQVNRFLAPRLAEVATAGAEGALAVDLYCGVGLITLPLARRFREVVGVDASGSAVRDLQSNASRARLRLGAVQMDVGAFLASYQGRPDLIVADPPRAGLGPAVVGDLVRVGASSLRIVSCDPATLARDLKALVAGGYALDRLTVVDMFPQTYHIETVAALHRT